VSIGVGTKGKGAPRPTNVGRVSAFGWATGASKLTLLCGTEVATGKTGAEKYGVIAGDVTALCGIKDCTDTGGAKCGVA